MTLVLEYPVTLLLYTVVILVLISIMWHFREQIFDICLFPPCNGGEEDCDVKPVVTTETELTQDVVDKYCKMCWSRNKEGECDEDVLCYIINVTFNTTEHSSLKPSPELKYCDINCQRNATSLWVQYYSLDLTVNITC